MHHPHMLDGRSVSVLLPGLSPCTLTGAAVLLVGGISSGIPVAGRCPKATRQHASLREK